MEDERTNEKDGQVFIYKKLKLISIIHSNKKSQKKYWFLQFLNESKKNTLIDTQ